MEETSAVPVSFFLPGPAGDLFAIYHSPAPSAAIDRGDVIYLHPFAEELNHSRHLISTLSRQLSKSGLGVLMVDLYGCGESAGDFAEARWEIWKQDVAAAMRWLHEHGRKRVGLWGLRMGALLAMDVAASGPATYDRIVLWQPVLRGDLTMTGFLQSTIAERGNALVPKHLVSLEVRRAVQPGELIEVAGHTIAADLILAIDRLELAPLGVALSAAVHWLELIPAAGRSFSTASVQIMDKWKEHGTRVSTYALVERPFWLLGSCSRYEALVETARRMLDGAGS
jgi:exosortase A-associated hydrolase 2